jgi:hypothetical protein
MGGVTDVLDMSMRKAVETGSSMHGEMKAGIQLLLNTHGLSAEDTARVMDAVQTMQEQVTLSTATRVTQQASETLKDRIDSHNADLGSAQRAIVQLESDSMQSETLWIQTRVDMALRDEKARATTTKLEQQCAVYKLEQDRSGDRQATNLDPYGPMRKEYHHILGSMDTLFKSRAKSVLAERHILELKSQATEAQCGLDLGTGGADMSTMTLDDVSGVMKSRENSNALTELHKDMGKSIQAIDTSIRHVLGVAYGVCSIGQTKETDILHKYVSWRHALDLMMDTTPNTEKGLCCVNEVMTSLLIHPSSCSLLLPVWGRVVSEYCETTRASNWTVPSVWELTRDPSGPPVWVKHPLPIGLDEGDSVYSDELKAQYVTQNKMLYETLRRAHPEACDLAALGSAHGRYSHDRVVFRGSEHEGLSVLQFFAQKLRVQSEGKLTSLLDSLQDSYVILSHTGDDIIAALRAYMRVIQKGLRHKIKVSYSQSVYRAAMVLRNRYPSQLAEVVRPYLAACPARYENDALGLCMTLSNDAIGCLEGFKSIMSPSKPSHPKIRANVLSQRFGAAYRPPHSRGGGGGRGGGGAGASRGGARLACKEDGCQRPINADLAERCDGVNTRFRCPACHAAQAGSGGRGGRACVGARRRAARCGRSCSR